MSRPLTRWMLVLLITMVLHPLERVRADTLSYPPQAYRLISTRESPKHTFRLETYVKEGGQGCIWLVAKEDARSELLVGPDAHSPLYPEYISVSPDEHWISWRQRLYHGANVAALYERASQLHYREIGPPIFSEQAWRFFNAQTGRRFTRNWDYGILISDWPTPGSRIRKLTVYGSVDEKETFVRTPNDHSLLIELGGNDKKTSVNGWFCYYDLAKHRFYVDGTLRKRNIGKVWASR